MSTDFRFGAGVTGSYYIYLPSDAFNNINPAYLNMTSISTYSYSAGVFVVGEWKWFNLKVALSYDFGANEFFVSPSIGLKF